VELALLRGVTAELHALPLFPRRSICAPAFKSQLAGEAQVAPQMLWLKNRHMRSAILLLPGLVCGAISGVDRARSMGRRRPDGLLLYWPSRRTYLCPTSQSGSSTAPEFSPPAAMAPPRRCPPQTPFIRHSAANTPRSTAQRGTEPSSTERERTPVRRGNLRCSAGHCPLSSGPQASAQHTNGAALVLRVLVRDDSSSRSAEPQSRADAATPSTASAVPSHRRKRKRSGIQSGPAATQRTSLPTGKALPARDVELFARPELESRTERAVSSRALDALPRAGPRRQWLPHPAQEQQ
jgi:hypothetical protein